MKRRDFIKVSSAAGIFGLAGQRYDLITKNPASEADGFDLHPFIKEHPEAVFINLTEVNEKTDSSGINLAASRLADEMFVKTTIGKGFPNSTKITCKPNWTCSGENFADPTAKLGINTDLNFIEGFLNSLKKKGPRDYFIRECACPSSWTENGWSQMAQKNNFDLRDLSTKDYWDLGKDDLIFKKVDGVVFKEVAFMAPMTAPDTFLINIAKFKGHLMGITASIKNLQGIAGKKFHQFCGGYFDIFESYDKRYHQFFQPDYLMRKSMCRQVSHGGMRI